MPRKKQVSNCADELLDELLSDRQSPAEILGESGLLKQFTKRLVERALAGELNHHLNYADDSDSRNSRNGHSSKTVQSEHGELDLAISRDRRGTFEPVLCSRRLKCEHP